MTKEEKKKKKEEFADKIADAMVKHLNKTMQPNKTPTK